MDAPHQLACLYFALKPHLTLYEYGEQGVARLFQLLPGYRFPLLGTSATKELFVLAVILLSMVVLLHTWNAGIKPAKTLDQRDAMITHILGNFIFDLSKIPLVYFTSVWSDKPHL